MKRFFTIGYLLVLLLTGCTPDDSFEINKGGFFKLYGNGTYQEAVAMDLSAEGDIFMIGNQYVRNQDSSALVLIRANAQGNQVWSRKYFGKGYTTSKALLFMPSNEVLILASSRTSESSVSVPVLYKINAQGDLLKEIYIDQEETTLNLVAEDMVLGENGNLFLVGNSRGGNGLSQKSFIKKINLASGEILDKRTFSNSELTDAKKIFKHGNQFLVFGDTRQEVGHLKNQNIFMATFSANLVEADHAVIGSSGNDTFKKAILSSRNEFLILATEQRPNSTATKGVVRFADPENLGVRRYGAMDYSANESPEAIEEDENGDYYVAVNSVGERGNMNILLNKIDNTGKTLWNSPKEIRGEGSDKIVQIKLKDGYGYLLQTIDMQNENTLISLSKVKF